MRLKRLPRKRKPVSDTSKIMARVKALTESLCPRPRDYRAAYQFLVCRGDG